MKRFTMGILVLLGLFIYGVAFAETSTVTLKQGIVYIWKGAVVKNLSTIQFANTKAIDSWPKWANALVDGWVLDAGAAWDATPINSGALLLGREFGTIGKYLPIDFPLKDKIKITLYPIGIYGESLFDHPKFKPCSGGAIIKLSFSF